MAQFRFGRARAARLVAACLLLSATAGASAGELTVQLKNAGDVTFVGAVRRWDADGNPLQAVDPKAKIDEPAVTARATAGPGGTWIFRDLPAGRYDLIILRRDRVRIEGFHYPPVLEFDPPWPPTAQPPDGETAAWVREHIAAVRRYENKVVLLFLAQDGDQVRVLVQLVRDQPTSFDAEAGHPVATARHEVWQFTRRFGSWSQEKATKILDRVLLPKSEFRRWTWVWEPALGGVEVGPGAGRVDYEPPAEFTPATARGWLPE